VEEGKPVAVSQNWSRARNSLGRKYLYLRRAVHPLVIMAKLIIDDLPAVSGISAGTGASSSAGVRKNVEITERALVVLLYLCSPKAPR
jgi:hypothetical protein